MPLKGEAKREYQRLYMRGRRDKTGQAVADALTRLVKRPTGRPPIFSEAVSEAAREGLRLALRSNRLGLDRLLPELGNLVEAEKVHTVAGEVTRSADNDARCRAIGMGLDLHERAGTIPSAGPEAGPTSGGGRVRMVQVDPDGTHRVLEIG